MSDALLLAIDQGTSATKAVVVDLAGGVRARASVPVAQEFPQPGWAEQDALEIWRSVQESVRLALAEVDPTRVAAVGLSTQRESMVAVGPRDRRAAGSAARLAGHPRRRPLRPAAGRGARRRGAGR